MHLKSFVMSAAAFADALVKGEVLYLGQNTNANKIGGRDRLPADAKFRWAYFDPKTCCFHLIFEHETFPELRMGDVIYVESIIADRLPERVRRFNLLEEELRLITEEMRARG